MHLATLRSCALLGCLALVLACSDGDTSDGGATIGMGGQAATGGTGGTGGIGGTGGTGGTAHGGSSATGGQGGGEPCVPGEATFTWTAPNQNEDGSCLTDLAGYALLYGADSGTYTHRTEVPLASAACSDTADENECGFFQECTITIVGLTPQLWYFVMIAINAAGEESGYSNEISKDLSCPSE